MTLAQAFPRRLAALAPLAAVLLLAGCGDLPLARDPSAFQAAEQRAALLAESGQHLDAAREYARLANEGLPDQRTRMAALAADQYRRADRPDDARRLLPAAAEVTGREARLAWAPVAARLALEDGAPERALAALRRLPEGLPPEVARTTLALEAEAHFALGAPREGVLALLARERLLPDESARLANHRLIWRGLQAARSAVHDSAREPTDDPVLAGWLALGPVAADAARNPFGVAAAISAWRERHPGHPAISLGLVDELLAGYRSLMAYPQRIALILPLSGRQAGVGLAVRDGFMAAYFEHRPDDQPRSEIRVYDSGDQPVGVLYRTAIQDGADFIIGPLLREEVEAIAPLAGQVPTLALNRLGQPGEAPSGLFQFALAPEDEAAQVARFASQRHGGRAIALIPEDDWGRRMLASFSEALEASGGRLLEFTTYRPWEQDHSGAITRALHLDQSEERRRRLAALARTRLEFQPRRRQDADFLFLAARAEQARQIRPQLRFFFAGELPTYAPSAVFQPGGGSDGDLNGIIFPDAPWLVDPDEAMRALRAGIERYWPGRGDRLGRLYAMGFDAYRLVPLLFAGVPEHGLAAVEGMSGRLEVGADGLVSRELAWGEFRGGRPVPLAPTQRGPQPVPQVGATR
ncbi:MAG: hypothetical protein EA371_08960 [Gammaproteobacteria bacterium]|nr:MAG: hypothetical protein EA371_08960 [Gammaproteobacteria bacterium]